MQGENERQKQEFYENGRFRGRSQNGDHLYHDGQTTNEG